MWRNIAWELNCFNCHVCVWRECFFSARDEWDVPLSMHCHDNQSIFSCRSKFNSLAYIASHNKSLSGFHYRYQRLQTYRNFGKKKNRRGLFHTTLMECAKPWLIPHIFHVIANSFFIYIRFELWAHKRLVKLVSGRQRNQNTHAHPPHAPVLGFAADSVLSLRTCSRG